MIHGVCPHCQTNRRHNRFIQSSGTDETVLLARQVFGNRMVVLASTRRRPVFPHRRPACDRPALRLEQTRKHA